MRKLRFGCYVLALATLSGCTSLHTSTDVTTAASNVAVTGVPYSLPMLQYEVKITRALAQCVDPADKKSDALKFAMTIEAAPHFVAGETFVIDYRKLSNFTKISSFSIEYQEKSNILKSINASVEDRTAEIAGNVIKSAIGIASLAGGIPLPPGSKPLDGSPPPPLGQITCGPKTNQLLSNLTVAAGKLKIAGEALKKATASVEELAARAAILSDGDKTTLTKRVSVQAAAIRALAVAQAAYDEAKASVSVVTIVRWPRTTDVFGEPQLPDPAAKTKFSRLLAWKAGSTGANAKDNGCDSAAQLGDCLGRKLTVLLKLDPLVTLAPAAPAAPALQEGRKQPTPMPRTQETVTASSGGAAGVFVRPPVAGRLLVCANNETSVCGDDGPDLLLRADDAQIPQLGTLRFLPFTNGVFQNNALVLVLADTGNVAKFEYKNLKASGESASAALQGAITDLRGYADARAAKRDEDEKAAASAVTSVRAAELATIQFEIERLQKQKTLADLTQPPAVSTTVAIQAQTAEIEARIANLKAQLAERQAQAALQE